MTVKSLKTKISRGEPPVPVNSFVLTTDGGIAGDAFAGFGERQISILLSQTQEKILAMRSDEPCLNRFSCNLEIEGTELSSLQKGTVFCFPDAEIEITAIGRKCHEICGLGTCPLVGGVIFAKVIRSGIIHIGDSITIKPTHT